MLSLLCMLVGTMMRVVVVGLGWHVVVWCVQGSGGACGLAVESLLLALLCGDVQLLVCG